MEETMTEETETKAGKSLADFSDKELIAEIWDRRCDAGLIDEFFEEVGREAIEELEEESAIVDLGELDQLNDVFWTEPEKAPAVMRQWLQKKTGRV
jgi:hypothetical protein